METLSVPPIDEKHAMTTSLDVTDLCALIDSMIKQEKASCRCIDYVARNKRSLRFVRNVVDEKFRSAMCQWCFTVARIHSCQRETVVEAFSYLDRYLCTNQGRSALVHRDIYELAVMTALHIAIKINEELVISIEELLKLSSCTYSQTSVERMEIRMLDALEWNLNVPTPCSFIQSFSALIPEIANSTIVSYAQHEVELAVSNYNFVKYKPSAIAFAALVKAILNLDNEILPRMSKEENICFVEQACGVFIDVDGNAGECLRFLLEEVSHPCQQEDDACEINSEVSTNANVPSILVQSQNDEPSLASSNKLSLPIDSQYDGRSTNQLFEPIASATVTNGMTKILVLETKPTLIPEKEVSNCSHALSA